MISTLNLFRQNVSALLANRGQNMADLAFHCGHDKSWASKILRGDRDPQLADFDRIADFFGLYVYQLLQPGISPLLERRIGERRTGRDRRGYVPPPGSPPQPSTRPFLQMRKSRAR